MKKVDQVSKVVESIDHPVTRSVSAVNADGKSVVRQVQSSSLAATLAVAKKLVLQGAAVSAAPDGFGSSTPGNGSPGGGKGGGRLMRIEDDLVPTSSTEAAALAERQLPDPLARLAGRAWRQMNELAEALRQLEATIAHAEQLQQMTVSSADVGMCAVVAGYELPWDEEWDVRDGAGRLTDFAGQLDEPFEQRQLVCSYVYKFVHKRKRLPTASELLEFLSSKARRR